MKAKLDHSSEMLRKWNIKKKKKNQWEKNI